MPSSKKLGFKDLRVLVTSGPTAVPVDGMRVITNRSTGEMGRLIAGEFVIQGARVTLLEGVAVTTTVPLASGISHKKFFFYDELARLLDQELARGYDIVIHAAAVSDYKLATVIKGKLVSGKALTLDLVPTKKLVDQIKKKAPDVILVGFKLETQLARPFILRRVDSLFKKAGCDLVVGNALNAGRYQACLIEPSGRVSPKVASKDMLVKSLAAWINHKIS